MSPSFVGSEQEQVAPVMVERLGVKGWTTRVAGSANRVDHALLLQQVRTMDQQGQILTQVAKQNADGGPPTTLSGTGTDLGLSYQGFATLDRVRFVNGNQLGTRATLQVDQGLVPPPLTVGGVQLKVPLLTGGFYNRLVASYTKFAQFPGLPKLTTEDVVERRKAPTTLVLHGRAGNCFGDMASYDYFTLGGPYSVRGYTHGELGACR